MDGKLRNMTSIYLYNDNDEFLLLSRVGSRVVRDNAYIGTSGGHFEQDELNDAKKCIIRELREETGLTLDDIEDLKLKYVTLRAKKGEIRQNYYFFAKIKDSNINVNSNEGKLKWFKSAEIKNLDMPHTAKYVIQHYIGDNEKYSDDIFGGIAVEDGVLFTKLKEF